MSATRKPVRRRTSRTPGIGSAGMLEMVLSHENALFGFTDRKTLKYIPGVVDKIDELTGLAKFAKKWGGIAVAAMIGLLLAIVFHQYGLIPFILNATR